MMGVTTLCIARESSDWHPTGSSTYEQAPTFLLTYITPEFKGSLLSPKLHQCFSVFHRVNIKNTIRPARENDQRNIYTNDQLPSGTSSTCWGQYRGPQTQILFSCRIHIHFSGKSYGIGEREGKLLKFSYNSTLWKNARCNLAISCFRIQFCLFYCDF